MSSKLTVCDNVKELSPDKETIALFEELLGKAKEGKIIGGIIIGLEPGGEVTHWVRSSQARINELVFGLRITEHQLLNRFVAERR